MNTTMEPLRCHWIIRTNDLYSWPNNSSDTKFQKSEITGRALILSQVWVLRGRNRTFLLNQGHLQGCLVGRAVIRQNTSILLGYKANQYTPRGIIAIALYWEPNCLNGSLVLIIRNEKNCNVILINQVE